VNREGWRCPRQSAAPAAAGPLPRLEEAPPAQVHQVVQLPPIVPEVKQYELHTGGCAGCNAWCCAPLPAGVPEGNFEPRLTGFMALCTGRFRLSKRRGQELLEDVLGMQLGLGSVSNLDCFPEERQAPDAESPSKGGTSASGHGRGLERAAALPRGEGSGPPVRCEPSLVGREPSGGLLGQKRPKRLSPREVLFGQSPRHPVYSFAGTVDTSSCVPLVMVHVQSVPSLLTARARP